MLLIKAGRLDLVEKWFFGFPPLPWQYEFFYAPQLNLAAVNGVATGKTTAIAKRGFLMCSGVPYYRFLNTSITAKQAELPFEMIQGWIDVNRKKIEPHIKDISLRPFPVIYFINGSEFHFRTAGTDARFIRGFEYDEANYDEGGFDYNGEVYRVLRGGRLRGNRPNGRPRKARFSVTTTPTEAIWLREIFDLGWYQHDKFDPKNYYSWRVSTYQNTALTKEQVENMVRAYSEIELEIEIMGNFPDYGLTTFPSRYVQAIASVGGRLYDEVYLATHPESITEVVKPGYILEEHPRHGVTRYEKPRDPNGRYIMAGDPGTGMLPNRNAAVVGVLRIDKIPAELVAFHWINGYGSYDNFIASFAHMVEKYDPVAQYMDTTGTQTAIATLAMDRHESIEVDDFHFSARKSEAVNALSLDISNQTILYPPIKGLVSQLSSYKQEDDTAKNGIAQDIVMTLGMLSWGKRFSPLAKIEASRPQPKRSHRRGTTRRRRV